MAIINTAHASRMQMFRQGIYSGIGWAIGVTVGFAFVSFILVFVLGSIGGIPLIGGFLAQIVDATTTQLTVRTPKTPLTPGNGRVSSTPTFVPSATMTLTPNLSLTPTP